MTWSYAGLLAAGCGQLSVAASGAWVVPMVIGTVLCASGVVIFRLVPSLVARVLAGDPA